MALKTVSVEVKLAGPDSKPLVNAQVEATLSGYEIDDGLVLPIKVKGYTNQSGIAYLGLWPNARGIASTHYDIKVLNYPGLLDVAIVVPDTIDGVIVSIYDIINSAPYPLLDASEQALLSVQASVVAINTQVQAAEAAALASLVSLEDAQSLMTAVSAAYVSSVSNVQDLRTAFLSYTSSHP